MRDTELPMLAKARQLFFLWLAWVLYGVFPAHALAAERAGVILAFTGQVEVVREARKLPASSRMELLSGDALATGEGQVQIRFVDGTLLTLYRNTRFAVDDYRYAQGKDSRAHFSLTEGLMHTLTGQIDKGSYQLKTRLANLGIRGTEYSVQLGEVLHVSVAEGSVSLSNAGGSLQVGAGDSAVVSGPNAMPRPSSSKIDLRRQGGGMGPPPPPPPGGGQSGGGLPPVGGGPGAGGPGGGLPPPPPPGTKDFSGQPPGSNAGDPPPPPGSSQNPPPPQGSNLNSSPPPRNP